MVVFADVMMWIAWTPERNVEVSSYRRRIGDEKTSSAAGTRDLAYVEQKYRVCVSLAIKFLLHDSIYRSAVILVITGSNQVSVIDQTV